MHVYLHHLGLILLGGVFVWAGMDHFLRFGAMTAMLTERGFIAPRLMLAAGSLLEVLAGLCLAADLWRPYAAAALILFTTSATFGLLDFWRHDGVMRLAMRNGFAINIAVIGGLLLAATGPI